MFQQRWALRFEALSFSRCPVTGFVSDTLGL
jgi:hypothetical protein